MKQSIEFFGSNLEVSTGMKDYFQRKIQRVYSHSSGLIHNVRVNFSYESKLNQHSLEIVVFLQDGKTLCTETKTENMYASIDIACASIERQMRKYKEKIITLNKHKASKQKRQIAV